MPAKATSKGYLSISNVDPRKINNKDAQLFRRKNFGFIYQDSIKKLNPLMRVGDHLYELFKTHDQTKSSLAIKKLVREVFQKVGIEESRLDSFPHQFSGGMRQRVSIAMALALKPKLLIADEPTTSLDTKTSFEIMQEIIHLCNEFDTTLILISHDIHDVFEYSDRVAVLKNGSLVGKKLVSEVTKDDVLKMIISGELI